MGGTTNALDLGRLGLSSGEATSLTPSVALDPVELGGQRYTAPGAVADVRVDVSRTTTGYALRLRYGVNLEGPCMRCLDDAEQEISIDAREVDQPGGGDDLRSPYLDGDELDVKSWARDALVLALPTQIRCSADCRGLCGICGANLNEDPEHAHEREPDPRWAKLSELKLD
ncbi:MAG: YceD family protein [Thermoleophilaceae bacterium]